MEKDHGKHHADAPHLLWETMGEEILYDAKIFRLRSVLRQSSDGRIAPFVSLDTPNWVTVIPELSGSVGPAAGTPSAASTGAATAAASAEDIAAAPRFLMVRQFRHGSEQIGLEFPAGIIDEGETPREAAARELLEETGYKAGELTEIGAVNPNPAFMNNTSYTYLARNLEKVSGQELDENEILDFHAVDVEEIRRDIGTGVYASAITVQAWYFYLKAVGCV